MKGSTLSINNTGRTPTPLWKRILLFALPIMAMNVLQLLFNAADMVVVGRFAGSGALAAVGATGALINLLVNSFVGMSVGTNVVVAQDYGAGRMEDVNRSLHTSLFFSGVTGFAIMGLGLCLCRPLLELMGTPEDIIDASTLYMRIYFIGIPANLVYNFGAAALRGVGDSKRPTLFLILTGLLNVILNLFFVLVLHMTVDGVAWATVISQYAALILLMHQLLTEQDYLRFSPRTLRPDKKKLAAILRIGVPAGLQSTMFSISNVLIQSGINSFGSACVAANSAVGNIEGFVNSASGAISNAAVTFAGQAVGAGDYRRIDTITRDCLLLTGISWLLIFLFTRAFGESLLRIYVNDPEVIPFGIIGLNIRMSFHFLTGIMNVVSGLLRGMGYSLSPMLNTTIFACLMRIVWISTVFRAYPSYGMLMTCYPVTWGLCAAAQSITLWIVRRKEFQKAGLLAR